MERPSERLTDEIAAAVASNAPGIVVEGPAGSGKTAVLEARFARLVAEGTQPERILVLERDGSDADRLRTRLEEGLVSPWEDLPVLGVTDLAQRVLRDGIPGGSSLELPLLGSADRLALLADAMDRLTFDEHDLGRDPLVLLASLIERIDSLELNLVDRENHSARTVLIEDARLRSREQEFAAIWATHDELVAKAQSRSAPGAIRAAIELLSRDAAAAASVAAGFEHVLLDGIEDFEPAHWQLAMVVSSAAATTTVLTDPGQAHRRSDGNWTACRDEFSSGTKQVDQFRLGSPDATSPHGTDTADDSGRNPTASLIRASTIDFWQATSERAQAQAVAAEIERLVMGDGTPPGAIAVIVGSVTREGPAIETALEERAIPNRVHGAQAFFQRPEIRDLLAWLRLLNDPADGSAVIRALARPPIGLGSADIARCSTIARRRRLDLVAALAAATESPQLAPESRERITWFLRLHALATRAIDEVRPDLFVHRLIERLGLRSSLAYSASPQAAERLRSLAVFAEIAAAHVRRDPQSTARDFARHVTAIAISGVDDIGVRLPDDGPEAVDVIAIDAVRNREWDHVFVVGLDAGSVARIIPGSDTVPLLAGEGDQDAAPGPAAGATGGHPSRSEQALTHLMTRAMTRARSRLVLSHARTGRRGEALHPAQLVETVRESVGGTWEERVTDLFAPGEALQATYRIMRDELLDVVETTGRKLLELRLDTGEDVDRAVVRFIELLKLSALASRPEDHGVADSIAAINERLRSSLTDTQRLLLGGSSLDSWVTESDVGERERERALGARREPSLEAFLPRRGEGLALSAGDIETYLTCPLKYKFARVMRVPQEPTTAQRFGIVVHQVLERWHRDGGDGEAAMLGLLEHAWRRSGLGDGERERQLKGKARDALVRYLAREDSRDAEAIWLERPFAFRIGPHILRGRVDRVDRHADGAFELIDYKTSFPKTADELRGDIQLTLYALGAEDAWRLEAVKRSYWYVLDDDRVEVPGEVDRGEIEATVTEVAEGILGQGFEPSPSHAACSNCDWRLACPAAESA